MSKTELRNKLINQIKNTLNQKNKIKEISSKTIVAYKDDLDKISSGKQTTRLTSLLNDINMLSSEINTKQKVNDKKKEENKEYIVEWSVDYNVIFKKDKKKKEYNKIVSSGGEIKNINNNFTIIGKKKDINDLIEKENNKYFESLEEQSPYESVKQINMTTPLFTEYTVQSSSLTNIKMKNAICFDLSGEKTQEWNKKNGQCVFDYLINLYGNTKGFIKIMTYENLDYEFGDDALNNGVCIEQIDIFCKKYNLSYYALNQDEQTIKYYIPENKKNNVKALIFRLLNSHMYPIDNEHKRKSIVNRHRKDINIKSIELEEIKKDREQKIYDIIAPEDDAIKNEYALNIIKNLNKIPYPINNKNISFINGNIEKLIIDDKIILTTKINKDIKEFYENSGRTYQGETLHQILHELWKYTYNEEMHQGFLMSSYNDNVDKLLRVAIVFNINSSLDKFFVSIIIKKIISI